MDQLSYVSCAIVKVTVCGGKTTEKLVLHFCELHTMCFPRALRAVVFPFVFLSFIFVQPVSSWGNRMRAFKYTLEAKPEMGICTMYY